MTVSLGRPRPPSGKLRDWDAVFLTDCQRCGVEVTTRAGIGMECRSCVAAAQTIWPWAGPISGEMSGE